MARRPYRLSSETLRENDLGELGNILARQSSTPFRHFYDRSYRDCRLIYRLPGPRQIQTLVQVWKELRKMAAIRG